MGKRINKERRSIATALPEKAAKRKRAAKLGIVSEEGDEEDEAKPRKRASGTGGGTFNRPESCMPSKLKKSGVFYEF